MRTKLVLSLVLLATVAGSPATERPVAITGATLVLEPGNTVEDGTIVLRNGLIDAVGGKVEVPFNARVIDGKGLTVYAGFIDASSQVGLPDQKRSAEERAAVESAPRDFKSRAYAATRRANRKGVRAEVLAADRLVIKEADARKHLAGGFAAAVVSPSGAYFSGRACLVNLSGQPRREVIVQTPLGLSMSFRASGQGYPGNALGYMSHIRQLFLDAQHYDGAWRHYLRSRTGTPRPPYDAALETIGSALKKRFPVMFEADSDVAIHRALNFADEFDFDIIIAGGAESHELTDRLKRAKVPVLLTLKFDKEPKQRDMPDRAFAERKKEWETKRGCAVALHEAGIPFAFSTRGLGSPNDALKNIAVLVEKGLPRDAAHAALTTTPARLFGVAERLGTLAKGKIANLTVLTKPLGDKEAKVRYAFVDGRKFEFEVKKGGDEKPEIDLTGKWTVLSSSDRGEFEATMDLKQDGAKVTGTFEMQWGNGTLSGTVSGKSFSLTVTVEEFEMKIEGKMEGKKLVGTTSSEYGDSEFTATRPDENPTVLTPFLRADDDVELDADRVPSTRTGGDALILNARILTVSDRGTIEEGWVLIEDGRIKSIGASDPPKTEAVSIDATGLTVIPGIIDCHAHIAASAINESSHSISAEVRIKDVIDPHSVSLYRAAAGGCTSANVLHGSANVIGGQNAVIKTKYGEDAKGLLFPGAKQGIKFALGENVKQSNWGTRGTRYPNTRMGVENLLRTAFTEAREYKKQWTQYAGRKASGEESVPPRRDLRLEALVGIMDGRIIVHSHSYRADEILMLMRVAESFGFRIATFQHVLEGYKVAPELAKHGAGASTFSDWWAYKFEVYEAIPYNAALMTRAGVVTSINSDSSNHMRYLNLEAAKSMKYGRLSADAALKLVTLNPAIQLRIDKVVGSIEPGKHADLALYNGHPLSPYSRCVMTLIDGEVVFEDRNVPDHATTNFDPVKLKRRKAIAPERNAKGLYAITNVRIVPVTRRTIPRGTVLIADGKIKEVGRDVDVPSGATVIDGAGLSVYPGMIDAGTSLGLTEIGSVQGSRDEREIAEANPELKASTAFNPNSELVPVARANGITTVLTAPVGGLLTGQAALVHLSGWTIEQAIVEDTIGLSVNFPNIPPGNDDEDRKKQTKKRLKTLRTFFEDAVEYDRLTREAAERGEPAQAPDLKLAALAPYATGKRPVLFRANGRRQISAAVEFAVEMKLKPVIVGGREAWKVTEILKKHDVPVILGPVLTNPSERYDPYDSGFFNAARLHKAGVRFCLQTGDASNVRNLPYQASVAAAYGLPRAEALKAVTIRPAQILGVDDRLGSIEAGKTADLILTTGDPLEIVTDVVGVFINGQPVSVESKHTRLYKKFAKRLLEGKKVDWR